MLPLSTFGIFSYFKTSLTWFGVYKGLQNLRKSDKNELRLLIYSYILISKKDSLLNLLNLGWKGGGQLPLLSNPGSIGPVYDIFYFTYKNFACVTPNILQVRIPYARHYNPRFVYFLPHFSVQERLILQTI